MIVIDSKGKLCPIPVIETKKALSSAKNNETILTKVDNSIAVENLEKMAKALGFGENFSSKKISDHYYETTIVIGNGSADNVEESQLKNIIVVNSNIMGSGDEVLGVKLLSGYFYALNEVETPRYIIFYNKGVMVSTQNVAAIEELKKLEAKGSTIMSCGLCLDYYNLKEELKVGTVTNMYEIATLLSSDEKVIYL
ncbi:MAG: sulfurtransferase-like selenium metabolism protein YedF [Lachnospirales bacterium]